MNLNTELTRFKVIAGKEVRAEEWLTFLRSNLPLLLLTLEDEKMYVETIFSEIKDNVMYLYWHSIKGEGGSDVKNSLHEVDKKHLEFWKECIDYSFKYEDLKTEVVLIPGKISIMMK